MSDFILTNKEERTLKHLLPELAIKADKIRIATAFFSDTEFIIDWLNNSKQIDLLISLRPPTNYYSLSKVHPKFGINIQFLGDEFHSKFFIFYEKEKPFACVIGSSNFTSGGLYRNIETNAIFTDAKYLTEIEKHFKYLWELSYLLQPTDLANFKSVFDNFQKSAEITTKEQNELLRKLLTGRTIQKRKPKVGKEAKEYSDFWGVVNDVRGIVNEISVKEYPNIPVYLTIDHFWHWVKTVWSKENKTQPTFTDRESSIQNLFKEYCNWDKNGVNHTIKMDEISKVIFRNFLSKSHIDNLTKEQARLIYINLHFGKNRATRFKADEKFINENTIQQIRHSLKYLLYSNDGVDIRIHQLCVGNSPYKLKELKSSGAQELIGWVNPDIYPIRNHKADEALKLLGFKLN